MPDISRRDTKTGEERWRVRYRIAGRGSSQRVKTFATEDKAAKFAGLIESLGHQEAERILAKAQAATERTVSEQVAHHIAHLPNITEGTRSDYETYARDIDTYLGPTPLSALTRDQVTRFAMALRADPERQLSHKSIKHRHSLLSAALKSAMRADLLTRNVAEGVELPKDAEKAEMVTLTVLEVGSFIESAPEHWQPLIATLVGTGMRISEATALKVKHVDLEAQVIHIHHAWKHTDGHGYQYGPPKSAAGYRTVHIGSLVHPLRPIMEGRSPDDWLFTTPAGGVVRYGSFYDGPWLRTIHAFAGDTKTLGPRTGGRRKIIWTPGPGKRPRVHDLRHTYASIKIREGKSMAWLQKQLGHESIETTIRTYTHLMPSDLAALGDIIDWTPTGEIGN
jgi:integrase